MSPLRRLVRDLTADSFGTAVAFGLLSVPITIAANWSLSAEAPDGTALLLACVATGYAYRARSASATRAGALTGFVGSIPLVFWQSRTALLEFWGHPTVTNVVGESTAMVAVALGAALVTAAVLVALLSVVGALGGRIGAWLGTRLSSTGGRGVEKT